MKNFRVLSGMILAAILSLGMVFAQSGYDLFQKALVKERAEGDLKGAIPMFQRVVHEAGANRELAAKALVEMGGCYEKLGQADAQKAYERVLRDYADQSAEASEARARLAALEHGGARGTELVTRRIWAGPDADPEGSPSPDGRYLSYVNWETNNVAIYDVATGKKRDVTHNDPKSGELVLSPKLSPDGKRIAYTFLNKDLFFDLRVFNLDGSEPRIIYSNKELEYVGSAGWSPDGRTILALFTRKDRTNQIALISVADGSVRILKTLDWRYPNMIFSPDGRYIAYDYPPRQDSDKRDIFVLAADGSRENPLIQHPADDQLLGWAPDGKTILFRSDRTGDVNAWAIQVADGKPQGSPELVKSDIGRVIPMGFTRNGSFYYGVSTDSMDVYLAALDPATGKLLDQPSPASQHFMGPNPSAEFSPDGKDLAYFAVKPQPSGETVITLYIRSLSTGTERELSPDLLGLGHPNWSPDGRSILVTGYDKKRHQGLYEVDVHSGAVKPIVLADPGTLNYGGVWTSDGKSFFYWHNVFAGKSSRIVLHHLATGGEEVVYRAPSGAWVTNIAPSPDGGKLALTTSDTSGTEGVLRLMSTAGGEARELGRFKQPRALTFGSVVWTPNGRHLLFATVNGMALGREMIELWWISPEGGQPESLGNLARGVSVFGPVGLRVSLDGRQIAFTAGQHNEEVWVMQNFLPSLRAAK